MTTSNESQPNQSQRRLDAEIEKIVTLYIEDYKAENKDPGIEGYIISIENAIQDPNVPSSFYFNFLEVRNFLELKQREHCSPFNQMDVSHLMTLCIYLYHKFSPQSEALPHLILRRLKKLYNISPQVYSIMTNQMKRIASEVNPDLSIYPQLPPRPFFKTRTIPTPSDDGMSGVGEEKSGVNCSLPSYGRVSGVKEGRQDAVNFSSSYCEEDDKSLDPGLVMGCDFSKEGVSDYLVRLKIDCSEGASELSGIYYDRAYIAGEGAEVEE